MSDLHNLGNAITGALLSDPMKLERVKVALEGSLPKTIKENARRLFFSEDWDTITERLAQSAIDEIKKIQSEQFDREAEMTTAEIQWEAEAEPMEPAP